MTPLFWLTLRLPLLPPSRPFPTFKVPDDASLPGEPAAAATSPMDPRFLPHTSSSYDLYDWYYHWSDDQDDGAAQGGKGEEAKGGGAEDEKRNW